MHELLGIFEPALDEREHRAVPRELDVERVVAESLGEEFARGEVGVGRGAVTRLEMIDHAEVPADQLARTRCRCVAATLTSSSSSASRLIEVVGRPR